MIKGCFDCEGWGIAAVLPAIKSAIACVGVITTIVFLLLATIRLKHCMFQESTFCFVGSLFGIVLLLVAHYDTASTVVLVIEACIFIAVPLWLAFRLCKLLFIWVDRVSTSRKRGNP